MATRTRSTGATFAPGLGTGSLVTAAPLGTAQGRHNELTPAAPTAAVPDLNAFNLFDDPSTKFFTDLLGKRINSLQTPIGDPTRDAVMALISGQIPGMLNASVPSVGYGGNSLLGDLITSGRQRIEELNQEPYSQGEEAAMKTKAAEEVEQYRTSSRQRALEDTARLGQAKTSGTLQARYADVDRTADSARAKGTNDLMLAIAQERQRRKDQAVQVAQGLASAGQAEAGMQMQGQSLQLQASGQAAQQKMQALSLAQSLAQMSAASRAEQEGRENQAIGYAGTLADLPAQRLQLAMSVLNGTGGNNPASIVSGLSGLSGLQTNANNTNNQQQAALMYGLGQLLSQFTNRS